MRGGAMGIHMYEQMYCGKDLKKLIYESLLEQTCFKLDF